MLSDRRSEYIEAKHVLLYLKPTLRFISHLSQTDTHWTKPLTHRKSDLEIGSFTHQACYGNTAAHQLRKVLNDRKTQSGAA